MKTFKGVGRYNAALMEVSGRLLVSAVLSPGKEPRFPIDRTLDRHQSLCGRFGDERNLSPAGNGTPAVESVDRHYTIRATPALAKVLERKRRKGRERERERERERDCRMQMK
jgi:hypothetical protein